ncbi:Hypothetical predicted protein [Cloeon dipterum]|uniref:Uncharacterized protein n=1 Tax=Cloeon dipterum TaxID=197152 RepID=A0A8S1E4S4_9INSE|nr:Hypothetical predicted protein [Cloeon dipterum]
MIVEFVDFNQAGVKMDETKKLRSSKKRKFPSCEEELSNANYSGHVCMKLNDVIICPFPNCPVVFVGSDSKERLLRPAITALQAALLLASEGRSIGRP